MFQHGRQLDFPEDALGTEDCGYPPVTGLTIAVVATSQGCSPIGAFGAAGYPGAFELG